MNFEIGQNYLVNEIVNNVNEFVYHSIDEFYVKVTTNGQYWYLTWNIDSQEITVMFNRRPTCRIDTNKDGDLRLFCH